MRLDDLLFGPPLDGAPDDPDAFLLHAGGADHSVGEVRARATAIADAVAAAGAGRGSGVAAMLPSSEVVPALFGIWRAGGAYVPLNPRLGRSDLEHVVASVDPAVVVTTAADADRFGDRALVVVGTTAATGWRDEPEVRLGAVGARTFDDDVSQVQFTSGTTGRPKPVLLTHSGQRELLDDVVASLRAPGPGPRKAPMPNLIPVSMSLSAGLYQVLFARVVGAPIVVMDAFDTAEFARLVERFGIRSTVLPPAAMTMLCDDPAIARLDPLRYVRSISAPLSPLQARRFHDRFGVGVLNCYGQTEIGGEIIGWTAADWKAHADKVGAIGRPHSGVQVRTDAGSGELQVRTTALSAGYADGNDLSDRLTDDGWFRTGDVGRIDDDGFVWIEGRLSAMINRGGLKVFPAEVEEVLRLDPAVADVAVAGVPDDRLGEVPWAFVVPADTVDEDRLRSLCRDHLAPYKVPAGFTILDAVPRNEIGKVLVHELVAQVPR